MIQYKQIRDLTELPQFSIDYEIFSDIETQGLYINTRLVQVYQPETSELIYIIDCDYVGLEEVKQWLKPFHTVWQGASYDFGTLNMTTEKFDDTLYLARIAYPEWQNFTLDNIVKMLGYSHLYDSLDKKKLQKMGFVRGAYLSKDQLRYSATDVYALSLIWKDEKIQKAREVLAYKVDILSMKYAIEYQQNGLIPDRAAVRKELDAIEDEIESNYIELDGLNPNSPKQVKEALGTDSSSKEVLIKLIAQGSRLAELVYKQRRLLKRRTMLNSYNATMVYTRFNVAGAATGRFTSTGGDLDYGINAQQIPRDLQYIFNTNTENTVVIHADYSTAELRAGASIMRDEAMYEELKAHMDLHKIAATMASGVPIEQIDKGLRQKGKAVSFGKIFGQSWKSFIEFAYVNYGVIFTEEESQEIHSKYNTKYTGISVYHKKWWNNYKTHMVSTPLGHRNKARLGTDAINYATQGCIAETMKLAIHYLCSDYPEATKYIFNVVHDAAYLRVPKGKEKVWSERLVDAMAKGWQEICKVPMLYYKDIPMPIELEYTNDNGYFCKEVEKGEELWIA